MAKILFEEEGGGDYGSETSSSTSSIGYGSMGGGGVDAFRNTFIQPFIDIFRTGQYGVERATNAVKFFGKKLAFNLPRLFMPSAPFIFKEIRDQENAAIQRMDKRYSEVLERNNEALKNKDIKAMLFLLNPAAYLSAKLIQKSPKLAWETANTLSGNMFRDLYEDIKRAYYALPEVKRRNLRVQEYVRLYAESDKKNQKVTGKSTVPDGANVMSQGYDYSSSYGDYDFQTEQAGQQAVRPPTNKDFLEAAFMYLDNNPDKKNEYFGKAISSIQNVGMQSIQGTLEKASRVLSASSLENYSKLTGADLNMARSKLDSFVQAELSKQKDIETDKAKQSFEEIKKVMEANLLQSLKKDYSDTLRKSVIDPLLKAKGLPENLRNYITSITNKMPK